MIIFLFVDEGSSVFLDEGGDQIHYTDEEIKLKYHEVTSIECNSDNDDQVSDFNDMIIPMRIIGIVICIERG